MQANNVDPAVTAAAAEAVTVDPDNMWSIHAQRVAATPRNTIDAPGGIPVELRQFLDVPVDTNRQANPLELWEGMRYQYPRLYKMSRDFLTRLATSVPSERLFSKAGIVSNELRSRLTGKRLSKLLFLASLSLKDWQS